MVVFSRNSDDLINDIYKPVGKLGKLTDDIRNKKFGKLKPIFPVQDNSVFGGAVFWVCLCECGMYYRVLPWKLKNKTITCCPVCNDGVVTDDTNVIHPINIKARKTDEELAKLFTEEFYTYFKNDIELEDFKQEIHYIFALNRYKGKSRTWCIQYYLRDLKCRLRNHSKQPIKYSFDSYENAEILVENLFDYIDIYPIDKILNYYLNECLYLTNNEKQVLKYIYFNKLSTIKIGKIMNLSKQRISQIHINALHKLKKKIKK